MQALSEAPPGSVCSCGSPRQRSGSPAPRLLPWNEGQPPGWPVRASCTVGRGCHPEGRSGAEKARSGLTVAVDRARGKRLRAQRGPKPVLPRFGKLHSFRWSGACGQVLSCVRPHCLRHLTCRGPVWRYAGRVQNRPCVLEGTGADHWFSRPRLVDRLPLPSSDLLAFPDVAGPAPASQAVGSGAR